jgi:4-hydroxybenzoate polyprenyltransferase
MPPLRPRVSGIVKKDLQAALLLVRAWNLILLGSIQYLVTIGFMYGIQRVPSALISLRLFFITLVTTLVGAAGYAINEYQDAKTDSISMPERVIVGRLLHRRKAILLHITFCLLAIILAYFHGWRLVSAAFIGIAAMWVYSSRLQYLPFMGELLIAILAAGTVYLPFFAEHQYSGDAVIFSIYGFFVVFIRQIIKSLRDLPGDTWYHNKSIPILIGIKRTKELLASLFALFCTLLFVFTIWLQPITGLYFLMLMPFFAIVIYSSIRADTIKRYRLSLTLCKIFIILGALGAVIR